MRIWILVAILYNELVGPGTQMVKDIQISVYASRVGCEAEKQKAEYLGQNAWCQEGLVHP